MNTFVKLAGLLLLLLLFSFNKQITNDEITWSKDRKLTWGDYQGVLDSNSQFGAISVLSCSFECKKRKDTLIFLIVTKLNTKESQVKPKAKTETLLKHEQTHFDIRELYTRKLRKQFLEFKFSKNTYKKIVDSLYNSNDNMENQYQGKYDKETNLSRNRQKQAEWDKRIAMELQELDNYTQTTIKYVFKM